jgi:hypothetical protein
MPGLPPEEVAQLLEQRLATQTEAAAHARRFMDQAYGHGMPRLFAIEHEYELALLKAEVEFLTELVSELREERMEGLAFWRRVHEMRADGRTADEIEAMLREQLPGGDSWVEKVRNNTDM